MDYKLKYLKYKKKYLNLKKSNGGFWKDKCISGNCENGYGFKKKGLFSKGEKGDYLDGKFRGAYVGERKNGIPDGKGKMTFYDNYVYDYYFYDNYFYYQ